MTASSDLRKGYKVSWKYVNVCWKCRDPIDSSFCLRCSFCGWFICETCGACSGDKTDDGYGCVDMLGFSQEEMNQLREANKRGIDSIKDTALFGRYLDARKKRREDVDAERERVRIEEENLRLEEEKRRHEEETRTERMSKYKEKLDSGVGIYSDGHFGRFIRYRVEGTTTYAYFQLDSGYIQSFAIPDAIDSGRIRFAEDR